MGKQFVASDVQATHYANPLPGIDQGHLRSDEGIVEVRLAARDQSSTPRTAAGRYIADIDKPFGSQQFVGDVQWREADVVGYRKSNSSRFWRRLLGERIREAHEASDTSRGEPSQESSAARCRMHDRLSLAISRRG